MLRMLQSSLRSSSLLPLRAGFTPPSPSQQDRLCARRALCAAAGPQQRRPRRMPQLRDGVELNQTERDIFAKLREAQRSLDAPVSRAYRLLHGHLLHVHFVVNENHRPPTF